MKYRGRILGVLILASIAFVFIVINNFFNVSEITNSFVIIIYLVILWNYGKQYDKADYYARELKKSREELQQILDNIEAGIWRDNYKTNVKVVSAGIEKIYGRPRAEFNENPEIWKEAIYDEDKHIISKLDGKLFTGEKEEGGKYEYRIVHPDGEIIWVQSRVTPTFDENNDLVSLNGFIIDITDRKKLEKSLVEAETKYRNLVEGALIGVYIYQNGHLIYVNPRFEAVSGYKLEELQEINVLDLIAAGDRQIILENILKQRYEKKELKEQVRAYKKDGNVIDIEINATPITYNGAPALIGTVHDITSQKKAFEEVNQLAYHDALTGLPNRYLLNDYINRSIDFAKNNKQNLGIMFIDLDRFKIINDTMGHSLGDRVLERVAKRLLNCIGKHDIVSRHGGDEFIILLTNIDEESLSDIAQKIIDEISRSFVIDGHEIFITPSIGISMYPKDGGDVETLIKYADTAMYEAKDRGKNNYQFYTSELNKVVSGKMELEHGLRKALENNEFVLYYQPQVDLNTGKIVSMEALIRWNHPHLGIVPPMEFIPLAEETGLIIPIGKWALITACKQNKEWQNMGLPKIPVAVNISARQLQNQEFVKTVSRALSETCLEPEYLELEITESIMQNTQRLLVILKKLKVMGIKVAVDDFGTGYSALGMLKHLPIDILKIDKSFIDETIVSKNTGALVKTIIDMGHSLNFDVIAEGIEVEEQAKFLKQNNCNIGQGYLYSKPMTSEEIGLMLKKAI